MKAIDLQYVKKDVLDWHFAELYGTNDLVKATGIIGTPRNVLLKRFTKNKTRAVFIEEFQLAMQQKGYEPMDAKWWIWVKLQWELPTNIATPNIKKQFRVRLEKELRIRGLGRWNAAHSNTCEMIFLVSRLQLALPFIIQLVDELNLGKYLSLARRKRRHKGIWVYEKISWPKSLVTTSR